MSSVCWEGVYKYHKPTKEELSNNERNWCPINAPDDLPEISFVHSGEEYLRAYAFSYGINTIIEKNKATGKAIKIEACNHSMVKWTDEKGQKHIENGMDAPYVGCGEPKCVSFDHDFTYWITDYKITVFDLKTKKKTVYEMIPGFEADLTQAELKEFAEEIKFVEKKEEDRKKLVASIQQSAKNKVSCKEYEASSKENENQNLNEDDLPF